MMETYSFPFRDMVLGSWLNKFSGMSKVEAVLLGNALRSIGLGWILLKNVGI